MVRPLVTTCDRSRWIGQLILLYAIRAEDDNKLREQVQSSSGFAIFSSRSFSSPTDPSCNVNDTAAQWIAVGRAYERFALCATQMLERNAFLNQPVEDVATRSAFAKAMGLNNDDRPELIIRFGRAPEMPRSPRRSLEKVLVMEDIQYGQQPEVQKNS